MGNSEKAWKTSLRDNNGKVVISDSKTGSKLVRSKKEILRQINGSKPINQSVLPYQRQKFLHFNQSSMEQLNKTSSSFIGQVNSMYDQRYGSKAKVEQKVKFDGSRNSRLSHLLTSTNQLRCLNTSNLSNHDLDEQVEKALPKSMQRGVVVRQRLLDDYTVKNYMSSSPKAEAMANKGDAETETAEQNL